MIGNRPRSDLGRAGSASMSAWQVKTTHWWTNHAFKSSRPKIPSLPRSGVTGLGILDLKYIQANSDIIIPVLPMMALCDAQKQSIPFLDIAVLHPV
jgi:hypothetical protein